MFTNLFSRIQSICIKPEMSEMSDMSNVSWVKRVGWIEDVTALINKWDLEEENGDIVLSNLGNLGNLSKHGNLGKHGNLIQCNSCYTRVSKNDVNNWCVECYYCEYCLGELNLSDIKPCTEGCKR